MSQIAATTIGSGTHPYTTSIRPGESLAGTDVANGVRTGIQTVLINPEEFVSSPFLNASGISIVSDSIRELQPLISLRRMVEIKNIGPGPIYLRPDMGFGSGFYVGADEIQKIPVMNNVQIYVKAGAGGAIVYWLEY